MMKKDDTPINRPLKSVLKIKYKDYAQNNGHLPKKVDLGHLLPKLGKY